MRGVRFRSLCLLILLLSSLVLSSEKRVEVTNFFAKLYLAPSINSKFMGLAQRGERYPILLSSNYWFRIDFKGVPVWVENSNVQIVDSDAPPISNTEVAPDQNVVTAAPKETVADKNIQPQSEPQSEPQPQSESQVQPQIPASSPQNTNSGNAVQAFQSSENKRSIASKVHDSIAQSSRLRRWISRENFSKLPIIEQNFEEQRKDKVFLVTTSPAKIFLVLSPDSPILGMANRGERLQLIGEGDSWCKVSYKDTVGWIERKTGKVVASGSLPILINMEVIIIVASALLLIMLVITFVKFFSKKDTQKSNVTENKKVLIIAKETKLVLGTLTNTATSIDKCFVEIGFETKATADLQNIKSSIDTYNPDVVLIDWRFDRTIINSIERIFTSSSRANSIVVVIYNVPDPSSMYTNPALPRMAFLGISFSDRDLFKIVTPLIYSTASSSNISQKGDQQSALEGEIARGNLMEVMQYIEVGRKTGCLIIEIDRPFCLIYFDNGGIIYASTAEGVIGREAIYTSLNLDKGKFRFLLDKKPKSSNTNLSTLEVLMSWTKKLDETFKHGLWTS